MTRCGSRVWLVMLAAACSAEAAGDTVVVLADPASMLTDDGTRWTVEKGRWFGTQRVSDPAVRVQAWDGKAFRRGWLARRHVKLLTDADVDLTREALRLNKVLHPTLDVNATLAEMDATLRRITGAVAAGGSLRERAQRLSERLFGPEGFRTAEPSALYAVLDGKQGNCLGLSLVYLRAARHANLPAWLVTAPKHVFVRVGAGQGEFFVETTQGGRRHDSTDYLRKHLGEQAMREAGGMHLDPLSAPQAVGLLHAELARTLRDAGEYAKAVPHYARAAEINPWHAEAYEGLGAALTGAGKLDAALGPCVAATEVNPRNPEAWCTLGVALRRLGRHAEACEKYRRAVAVRPRYDRAWCNWGVALERMGKLASACEKYAKAIAINPRNGDAWFNSGVALARLGRVREASVRFERAVALRPDDPAAHRYWGSVLHSLGQHDAARKQLERAAALERNARRPTESNEDER